MFGLILSFLSPRFDHVLQVIRDPMKQISAFTTHSNKTYNFAFHALSKIYQQNPSVLKLLKTYRLEQLSCNRGDKCNINYAAVVWMLWNQHVKSYADAVINIESRIQPSATSPAAAVNSIVESSCHLLWSDYSSKSKTRNLFSR